MTAPSPPRILVVGGAGTFGALLAEGIAATLPCALVLAGRDVSRARRAAHALGERHPGIAIEAVALDATRPDPRALAGLSAVADAAGPFRPGAHALPRACIEAGVPYVDIADGRGFVAGFADLDAPARAAGVPLLTGASSTPALSNAALDAITAGWTSVDSVEVAISPGNRAPRGLSVFQAILAYAGRPVRVLRHGRWEERPGWGLTVSRDLPGLGPRLLSLGETPDLDILPARHAGLRTAVFRAGLELRTLHLGLALACLPVRAGLLPSLVPLARPMRALAALFEPLGTDRGGMEVRAAGRDAAGRPARASWHLVAEAGHGPYVPTLPALAALRAILSGSVPPGARACVGILPLRAVEAELARHPIRTWISSDAADRRASS